MTPPDAPAKAKPGWARTTLQRLSALWRTSDPAAEAGDPGNPATAPPGDAAPADSWGAVAGRWLVPSASILYAIVGYTAQSSQEALLGLQSDIAAVEKYSASANGFFTQILTSLIDIVSAMLSWTAVPLGGHGGLLFAATLVAGLLMLSQSLLLGRPGADRRRIKATCAWLLAALLAGLIYEKFTHLDAPVARLKNVILEPVASGAAGAEEVSHTFADRMRPAPVTNGKPLSREGRIVGHAAELWTDLVCSRLGPLTDADRTNANVSYACDRTRPESAANLKGEFIAHIWLSVLIAILALEIIRSPPNLPAHFLAWAALAYLLTAPFAYGKLMMSTDFDYGLVRFKEAPKAAAGTTPRADSEAALILSRGANGTNVLELLRDTCADKTKSYQAIRLSSISPSEVRSIEHIYRQDVVTWATLNSHGCRGEDGGDTGAKAPVG